MKKAQAIPTPSNNLSVMAKQTELQPPRTSTQYKATVPEVLVAESQSLTSKHAYSISFIPTSRGDRRSSREHSYLCLSLNSPSSLNSLYSTNTGCLSKSCPECRDPLHRRIWNYSVEVQILGKYFWLCYCNADGVRGMDL